MDAALPSAKSLKAWRMTSRSGHSRTSRIFAENSTKISLDGFIAGADKSEALIRGILFLLLLLFSEGRFRLRLDVPFVLIPRECSSRCEIMAEIFKGSK